LAFQIQQQDSQRRNQVTALNRYKKQLRGLQPESSITVEAITRLEEVENRIETVDVELESSSEISDQLEQSLASNRQKLDGLKLDLEEYTRALEYMYQSFFASLFPGVSETAKNVFANLLGDSGCLVCGSRRPGLALEFQKVVENGECPVCHTPKEGQEQTSVLADVRPEAIQEQSTRIAGLKQELGEFEAVVILDGENYQALLGRRLELQSEKTRLQKEADRLKGFLPASAEEISRTQSYITLTEENIEVLAQSIRELVENYTLKLSELRQQIDGLRENLKTYFAEYAASFLAEDCNLTFAPRKLSLGQGIAGIEFPTFAVQMTSAVSPSVGTTRKEIDDVSESQKEFIDLAFRMAVLKAYATTLHLPHGAMMVIETPESSLDSVFIENAGDMLRKWCALGKNSVIATSNLNRENMIRSLLGIGQQDPQPTQEEIQKRILNLIRLAAENAALKRHRKEYEAEFLNSTTSEVLNG